MGDEGRVGGDGPHKELREFAPRRSLKTNHSPELVASAGPALRACERALDSLNSGCNSGLIETFSIFMPSGRVFTRVVVVCEEVPGVSWVEIEGRASIKLKNPSRMSREMGRYLREYSSRELRLTVLRGDCRI